MIIISNVRLPDGGTLSYSPLLWSLETSPYSWNISTNYSKMQLTNQIERFNKGKWMPPKVGALHQWVGFGPGFWGLCWWIEAMALRAVLVLWSCLAEGRGAGEACRQNWCQYRKNTKDVLLLLLPWASAQAVFLSCKGWAILLVLHWHLH